MYPVPFVVQKQDKCYNNRKEVAETRKQNSEHHCSRIAIDRDGKKEHDAKQTCAITHEEVFL